MSTEKPKIVCLPNGPFYLLTDFTPHVIPHIQKSNNDPCSTITGVGLCRCGGSGNKPFCDGTHGKNGFTDKKLTDGTHDKRNSYVGKQITIHYNRGLCSHSGHCAVLRTDAAPGIDPDTAPTKDIIYAIENCPSGALSYSVDNVECRDLDREPMVTVTKNGPYAVTGGIELVDQPLGEGASKEHYALCRCGGSKNKPLCDGTHRRIEFRDEKN
jgi:CDGSH-type Zn-finger protein